MLVVLAPWFAELSWGGLPFTDIPLVLLFLMPLYGAAALLIREVARRAGRGWPTILLLATAFGVLQAGIVDQSLFNPAYGRFDFQSPVHVPGVDLSAYYLVAFVSGHVVASIAAPIVVAERWSRRPTEPWLSRRAVWVIGVVYILGSVVNHLGVKEDEGGGFQARLVQTVAAAAVVVALVTCALLWRRRPTTSTRVPRPWVLAAIGFAAYVLYLPGENAVALAFGVVVIAAVVVAVGTWSCSTHWTPGHAVALGFGSILVGVVMPFLNEPYDPSVSAGRELVDDVAAALICLAIVAATARRRRSVTVEQRAPAGV